MPSSSIALKHVTKILQDCQRAHWRAHKPGCIATKDCLCLKPSRWLTGTLSCPAHEAAAFEGARALLGSNRWKFFYGIIQQEHYEWVDECMIMPDDIFGGYPYEGVNRKP